MPNADLNNPPSDGEVPIDFRDGTAAFGVRFNDGGTRLAFRGEDGTIVVQDMPPDGMLTIEDRTLKVSGNDLRIDGDVSLSDLVVPNARLKFGKLEVTGMLRIDLNHDLQQ